MEFGIAIAKESEPRRKAFDAEYNTSTVVLYRVTASPGSYPKDRKAFHKALIAKGFRPAEDDRDKLMFVFRPRKPGVDYGDSVKEPAETVKKSAKSVTSADRDLLEPTLKRQDELPLTETHSPDPDEIQLESGIPVPPKRRGASLVRAAMLKMKVGESFVLGNHKPSSITSKRQMAKQIGIKITVRKIGENKFRFWRIA